jgi:hypothetical protein
MVTSVPRPSLNLKGAAMLEGINWGIVVVALVLSVTISLILLETHRLLDLRKTNEAVVNRAMADVDEEYRRLLESA